MMQCDTPARSFNTGRGYGPDRQPIVYRLIRHVLPDGVPYSPLLCTRWVVFSDQARGIDGAIPVFFGNLDLLTDRWVLGQYDAYAYRPLTAEERDLVHTAARA